MTLRWSTCTGTCTQRFVDAHLNATMSPILTFFSDGTCAPVKTIGSAARACATGRGAACAAGAMPAARPAAPVSTAAPAASSPIRTCVRVTLLSSKTARTAVTRALLRGHGTAAGPRARGVAYDSPVAQPDDRNPSRLASASASVARFANRVAHRVAGKSGDLSTSEFFAIAFGRGPDAAERDRLDALLP